MSYQINLIDIDRRGLHSLAGLLRVPLTYHPRALHPVEILRIVLRTVDSLFSRYFSEERVNTVTQLQGHSVDYLQLACLSVLILAGSQRTLIQNSYNSFHKLLTFIF